MYVQSPKEAKAWMQRVGRKAKNFSSADVRVAAPFTFLPLLKGLKIGGQTVSAFKDGAHTGEVSAPMLKAAGASFCLVGHSERRALESNDDVREELARTAEAGLVAVLCVGEREHTQDGMHYTFIEEQLQSALRTFPRAGKLVVAYEPVWAIGKSAGEAMQPEQVEETVIFIRKILAQVLGRPQALKTPILYGGSVEADNAKALLERGGVAGFLVGHASAKADTFIELLQACKN